MKQVLLLTLLLTFTASAFEFTGKVVGVADGDTITVLYNKQQYKIRFQHIDCPESTQAFGAGVVCGVGFLFVKLWEGLDLDWGWYDDIATTDLAIGIAFIICLAGCYTWWKDR